MPISRAVIRYTLMLILASSGFYANAKIQITIDQANSKRLIRADGLPDHAMGDFPNRHNPNRVRSQDYQLSVPLKPRKNSRAIQMRGQPFGIALNGVVFDPGTAETWRNDPSWRMEAFNNERDLGLDENHAHVQPSGAYHYHGAPTGLITKRQRTKPTMLGYAADGFPIYAQQGHQKAGDGYSPLIKLRSSYQLKDTPRNGGPSGMPDGSYTRDFTYKAGSGDLDECNGRFAVTPEYPQGIYHYVITDTFPYIPRCWMGTPDPSFASLHGRPGGVRNDGQPRSGRSNDARLPRQRQGRSGRMPPPEAVDACRDKEQDQACQVSTPHGDLTGTCREVPSGDFACVPERHPERGR